MANQIITDTFEALGQTAGQTVQQIAQEPGKMAEKAAQQVGVINTGRDQGVEQPQGASPVQQAKNQASQAKAKQRLTYLEDELRQIQAQAKQELPKQITGKPGYSEENLIKQVEEDKNPGLKKEEKQELPPVVAAAKSKASAEKRQFGGG
jgi:transcriptional regulator of acetoin/glycerol metabolism